MKRLLILLLLVPLSQACDDRLYSSIPTCEVFLTLNLIDLDKELNGTFTCKTYTQKRLASDKLGFGGILVINGVAAGNPVNLFAYDLACPVEALKSIKVIPDDTGEARCPKCGAVYYIGDGHGYPKSGSDEWLRSYKVRNEGNGKYIVYQ